MFGLYANEALTHVEKEEMDRLVLATEGQVPPALSELFKDVSLGATFSSLADCLKKTFLVAPTSLLSCCIHNVNPIYERFLYNMTFYG